MDHDGERRPTRGLKARLLTGVAVVIVVSLLGYFALRPAPQRDRGPAPDFTLEPLRHGDVITAEELRGRPVVLNFWASWCDPCRDEMPLFEAAWKRYRGRLLIVGVNVMDAPAKALEFLDEIEVTYPVVTDADRLLQKRLEITGLPQTLFIRSEEGALDAVLGGRIEEGGELAVGEISEQELRTKIEALLEGG